MLLNWGHIPQGIAAKVKGPTGVSQAQQLARLRFLVGGNNKVPPPGQHGPISNRHSALDPPPPPRPYKAGPGGPQQRSNQQTSGWDCGDPAAATAAADAPAPTCSAAPLWPPVKQGCQARAPPASLLAAFRVLAGRARCGWAQGRRRRGWGCCCCCTPRWPAPARRRSCITRRASIGRTTTAKPCWVSR